MTNRARVATPETMPTPTSTAAIIVQTILGALVAVTGVAGFTDLIGAQAVVWILVAIAVLQVVYSGVNQIYQVTPVKEVVAVRATDPETGERYALAGPAAAQTAGTMVATVAANDVEH